MSLSWSRHGCKRVEVVHLWRVRTTKLVQRWCTSRDDSNVLSAQRDMGSTTNLQGHPRFRDASLHSVLVRLQREYPRTSGEDDHPYLVVCLRYVSSPVVYMDENIPLANALVFLHYHLTRKLSLDEDVPIQLSYPP